MQFDCKKARTDSGPFCVMICSMSDYKTDLDRFMDQRDEERMLFEQEERRRAESYTKLRDKTLKDLALLGIKHDIPETPPED